MYRQTAKMIQGVFNSVSRRLGLSSGTSVAKRSPAGAEAAATRVQPPQTTKMGGATPATKATTSSSSEGDAGPLRLGPRVSWDPSDGEINAENMCSAFAKAGYPITKVLKFPAGHAMKDHAHNKKGNKRVGIAAGGKFCIRPKPAGGGGNDDSSSLSDVELSPGESVDIPPGLTHCAWVVGDQGVTFIMGDRKEL